MKQTQQLDPRQAGALIMTGDLFRATVVALVGAATSANAAVAGSADRRDAAGRL
jgi:hypothetical protein